MWADGWKEGYSVHYQDTQHRDCTQSASKILSLPPPSPQRLGSITLTYSHGRTCQLVLGLNWGDKVSNMTTGMLLQSCINDIGVWVGICHSCNGTETKTVLLMRTGPIHISLSLSLSLSPLLSSEERRVGKEC